MNPTRPNPTNSLPQPPKVPTPDSLTRVLHGLRDTAPTPGLEARLLHALATHQAHPTTPPSPVTHPLRWLTIPTLALATLALLVALYPHLSVTPNDARRTPNAALSTEASRTMPNGALSTKTAAQRSPSTAVISTEGAAQRSRSGETPSLKRASPQLSHDFQPQLSHNVPTQNRRETQTPPLTPATLALLEATAPSQPPPPLPITAEEQQIQRFAGRHNAFALAALSPATEPAREAADRQAFSDFFNPPPPAPPTTQTTTH